MAAASVVHRLVFVDWDGYAKLLKQISTAKAGIDDDPFGDSVDWVVRYWTQADGAETRHPA